MTASKTSKEQLVNRRDVASLVGTALGAFALAGCTQPAAAETERTDSTGEALNGVSFMWADTIADLRTMVGSDSSSTSQPVVVVGGYHVPNDGGGGVFYWDTTSSSGDNGGTIIVPIGSSSGRWVRLFSGDVNVRWFGAKGDGAADDTANINAAITVVNAVGGGVYIPPGTYKVTSELTTLGDHVWLRGSTHSSPTINSYVTDTLLYLSKQTGNSATYNGVENITFQCVVNSSPAVFETDAGAGVEIRGGGQSTIRNCIFSGFPIGICVDGSISTRIDHCVVNNVGVGYQSAAVNGKGIWFVDRGVRGRGFVVNDAVNCNVVTHCTLYKNRYNLEVNGGVSNQISDVVLVGSGAAGLAAISVVTTQNLDISAISCEGYDGAGSSGILVSGLVVGLFVRQNFISAEAPIRIANPGVVYNGVVTDNRLNVQGPGTTAVNAWTSGALVFCVAFDNVTEAGDFINVEVASGISYNKVGGAPPYGLGINKMQAAQAILHARVYSNDKPFFRIEDFPGTRYDHSSPSAQKHVVNYAQRTAAGTAGAGSLVAMETATLSAGPGAVDVAALDLPAADCLVTAIFTAQQWRHDDPTKYGIWRCSRTLCVSSGTVAFMNPTTTNDVPSVNTGSFTPPTLEADGSGNIVVRVYRHATVQSYATVETKYLITVKD